MPTSPPVPPPAEPSYGQGQPHTGPLQTALRALRSMGAALTTPSGFEGPPLAQVSGLRGRRLAYALMLALVAVLIPTTSNVLSQDYGLPGAVATSLGFAQAGPLLLAVTRPLQAWWIVITADTVGALLVLFTPPGELSWPWTAMVILGYLALCLALAVRESRRTLIAVWTVTVVLSLTLGFLAQDRSDGTNVLLIVLSGIVLLLGGTVRERADAQRRLAEQETISEAERSRRTLLEERTRIARELHDVVAHHMSVITVQADSAPYRLSGLPPEAQEEFGSIAATARESLSEMRRLLGVLRSEENHGERAPQPGLDRLGQLVEATVRAGVPTELSVAPGTAGLPQAVQLSAYRIVQEALANVVRHAPGAPTRVSVTADGVRGSAGDAETGGFEGGRLKKRRAKVRDERARSAGNADANGGADGGADGDAHGDVHGSAAVAADLDAGACLTVLVVNGPSPEPAGPPLETTGTGHGLVGMRERVRLVGGTLDTGPLADGGFRVAARLPLFAAPPTGKDSSPS